MNNSFEIRFEELVEKAMKQKARLIKIWENGETLSLTVERAATDDHPVANLISEEFPNWKFQLNRRLCVKGFLHNQKVGTRLEVYIDGFGEDQLVFASYVKKDHLPKADHEEIIKELRGILKEEQDINEQIENDRKMEPMEVRIDTVLGDHIVVEYKGLYATMTALDLFHSKSSKGMQYYRDLQASNRTMKVYVNTIDSTDNVTFSETRMPELCNNSLYRSNETGQPKWINDAKYLEGLMIGQTLQCIIWQYSSSGMFVIFKNNGGYVQSLIPNTALTGQETYQWAEEHPLNSIMELRITKIDKEQKRLTLVPTDVTTLKYDQQVALEKHTIAQVDEAKIKEGQRVEIEIITESKENQDILYAKCGEYRGVLYVKEDLPECLRHESGKSENGKIKRAFISALTTHNNNADVPPIKLPAIAHIKSDGLIKTYNFSVIDACSKCIEQMGMDELSPSYREVEIIISWQNPVTFERYAILRWHDLYTFFHLDAREIQELGYEGKWELGCKLTLWINGIDPDLSFDAEHTDPRLYWKSMELKRGDCVFISKTWLSRMGIYRTKIDGCMGSILPGFKLDEEQIDYHMRVVMIDKDKQIMILSDGSHQLMSVSDLKEENGKDIAKKTKERSMHMLMPLDKNLFLAEDHQSRKWAIIETTPPAYAFLSVIYNYLNIDTFIRLSESEEAHFKYREFSFPCEYTKDNDMVRFQWKGKVSFSGYGESFYDVLEKKGTDKVGWYFNQPYDLTCKDIIRCKILESERQKIKNWASQKLRKPKVYFTGKILYSNHEIFPLFTFNDPNIVQTSTFHIPVNPQAIDCRIMVFDERTNRYIVEFGNQRGLLACHESKELRFLPNETVKGMYEGSVDQISQMPYLRLLELSVKRYLFGVDYEASIVGRRMGGIVLSLGNYKQRTFLPPYKLFKTKEDYDKKMPPTIKIRYKGREKGSQKDIFELANPLVRDNKPPKGYACKITILAKNDKEYYAYITGGEFDGMIGYLPAKHVDFKVSINTTKQKLTIGEMVDATIATETESTEDIVFNTQNQTPFKIQFKSGIIKRGEVIAEEDYRYFISFDNIYGYAEKCKKLAVGRSYDFSIIEYVLGKHGPKFTMNGQIVTYRVILKVEPLLKTNKKNQLIAHVLEYDNGIVHLEAGIYHLYSKLVSEKEKEMFLNRFGKIELHPGTEVYVLPKDLNDTMFMNDTEVSIVKIKKLPPDVL